MTVCSNRIDELEDLLRNVKQDVELLDLESVLEKYSGPIGASSRLRNDCIWFLYFTLTTYKDIGNIVNYLLQKGNPLQPCDEQQARIAGLLSEAHGRISSLPPGRAFWIVIPTYESEDATWFEGARGEGRVELPFEEFYDHEMDTETHFAQAFRNGTEGRCCIALFPISWILHIHSSPNRRRGSDSCGVDERERRYVRDVKLYRPDIGYKTKFFLVQQSTVIEYREDEGYTKRWL
jgi:hypothetical protein